MTCCPFLSRGGILLAAGALVFGAFSLRSAETATVDLARECPMLGGTVARNPCNPVAKEVPADWSVQEGNAKNLRWMATHGTRGYASPVIVGGKVLVSTNNQKPRDPKTKGEKAVLMCFRESDGQFLWQLTHDMPPPEVVREARQDGLCSTPAVDGNHLYYVTPAAEVVCADTDGKILWRLDMMEKLKVFPCYVSTCSPLVAGDLVFVCTGNGRDAEFKLPAPEAPSFVAIDKKTGEIKWHDNSPGDKILEGQWSNPAYAEVNGKPQVIFGGGDGWLRAFEPATGKLIWKFDCNPKKSEAKPGGRGTRNAIVATPVVYENKVYVGVGQNPEAGAGVGHLWCVDLTKTGDVSPVDDNFDPQAPVNKGSALVWHYGGPGVKDAAREYVFGRTMSSCAIQDGLLYIAELEGFVYCLDARTGQKLWEHDLKANVWGSPYYVDGKVYLGTDEGDVYIFAAGKEKKLLGQVAMERAVKSTPVAVNGALFIVNDAAVYAIGKK